MLSAFGTPQPKRPEVAFQPARGTHDLIGENMRRHREVVETARRVAGTYGFDEWQTPIFEPTALFARSLGDTSDIVTKEMYTFEDRGGDGLTLRPEGTAGVCRALVTNGLTQSLPQRVFYAGPMFRYERPQRGRYRQFHQIGAELIGTAEPLADAEIIALARDILTSLGLASRVRLELNTLGDAESRSAWRDALVAHFTRFRDHLSPESRTRLERNPLRILDSKDDRDRALIADAPTIEASLNDASRAFWNEVRAHLAVLEVPFVENPRIVRGLDYYSHTAFEFTTDELGAQSAVLAGGRYDGLVAEIGGPPTAAVGWAAGIERLSLLLSEAPPASRPVAVIPLDGGAHAEALRILAILRRAGLRAEMSYRGNTRRRLERANRIGAIAAILLGEDERARCEVTVRLLDGGAQHSIAFDDLPRFLLEHVLSSAAS